MIHQVGQLIVTNGVTSVFGHGTMWLDFVAPMQGWVLTVGGHSQEVLGVVSQYELTLAEPWSSTSTDVAVDYRLDLDDEIQTLRAGIMQSINVSRQAATQKPVTVSVGGYDHMWDADMRSQQLLTDTIVVCSNSLLPWPVIWRDFNNDDVPVTPDDIKNITSAIALQTSVAYTSSFALKSAAMAATTVEELRLILP